MSEKRDNELAFYELDPLRGKGKEIARTQIGSGRFYGWDISPDGSHLAIVSSIGPFVRTIDLGTGKIRDVNAPKNWSLQSDGWSADGSAVFVTAYTPKAFVLGRIGLAGSARILLQNEKQWMNDLVASPDGHYLAFRAQTWDSNVWLLDGL
jgi:eukaryotic-like serine/threonine-protein kinase